MQHVSSPRNFRSRVIRVLISSKRNMLADLLSALFDLNETCSEDTCFKTKRSSIKVLYPAKKSSSEKLQVYTPPPYFQLLNLFFEANQIQFVRQAGTLFFLVILQFITK